MGYYTAGGGGYYMAGGFSLKRLARRAVGAVGKVSKLATKAAPFVTMFNPALGMSLATLGGAGSRIHGLLGPVAAPAGAPYEGTPPLGPFQKHLSQNEPDPHARIYQPWGGGGPPGINNQTRPRYRRQARRRRRY